MLSLTYVSRPTNWIKDRRETLEDIRAVSTARNSELNVTGLLIATIAYFAHVLEGPDSSINMVMASILSDPRHCQVIIVDRAEIEIRRHSFWRLACFESEKFTHQSVTPVLSSLHTQRDGESLGRFVRLTDAIIRTYPRGRSGWHSQPKPQESPLQLGRQGKS